MGKLKTHMGKNELKNLVYTILKKKKAQFIPFTILNSKLIIDRNVKTKIGKLIKQRKKIL